MKNKESIVDRIEKNFLNFKKNAPSKSSLTKKDQTNICVEKIDSLLDNINFNDPMIEGNGANRKLDTLRMLRLYLNNNADPKVGYHRMLRFLKS